jgi:hypothetical protein
MLLKDLIKVREVYPFDVLQVLREKGIVLGKVVMDSRKFITVCGLHGVSPGSVMRLIGL